jgi:hypothetical protein
MLRQGDTMVKQKITTALCFDNNSEAGPRPKGSVMVGAPSTSKATASHLERRLALQNYRRRPAPDRL